MNIFQRGFIYLKCREWIHYTSQRERSVQERSTIWGTSKCWIKCKHSESM